MPYKTNTQKLQKLSLFLAWAAGIFYCSWPLGYALNQRVGNFGFASELEAPGQPYSWLFIGLDIVSGGLLILVAIMLWYAHAKKRSSLFRAVLISYGLFGVLTIIDALLPLPCLSALRSCVNVSQDSMLMAHGLVNIIASISLFISVVLAWWRNRDRQARYHAMIDLILAGWIVFGTAAFAFTFVPGAGNTAQHYFITFSSIWVVILPYILRAKSGRLLR